jgi:cytochrome c oxidase cbb3-type subunit III
MIGPNLADDVLDPRRRAGAGVDTWWVPGVLAKGMPAWQQMLQAEQLDRVTAYVLSLQGTNPPNPKAPEGTRSARDR